MSIKINHSKYKNVGILFEILVRTITADTLSGKDSKALGIMKKYFVKTELGREYKLYDTVTKTKNLTEGKAEIIINSVVEASKNLNQNALRRQKYNLIKEISTHYDLDTFFKCKLPNYKAYAALYTLIEIYKGSDLSNTEQIINNKITLLEHLTSKSLNKNKLQDEIMDEFSSYDKGTRLLTYKIMLEKFNGRYDSLNERQKLVLKEYIYSIDSKPALIEFYNNKISEIKEEIEVLTSIVEDKSIQIKLNEVSNMLIPLLKNDKIDDTNLVNLLQYYELLEELSTVNEQSVI